MMELFLGRQRREVARLSQQIDQQRRMLSVCLRDSRVLLGQRLSSRLGLALCFTAGFFSKKLIVKGGQSLPQYKVAGGQMAKIVRGVVKRW